MSQRFTWGKAEKLKSRKRIERVFRDGKSFSLFPYRVIFLLQPIGGAVAVAGGVAASASDALPGAVACVEPKPGDNAVSQPIGGAVPTGVGVGSGSGDAVAATGWAALQAGFGASSRHFKKAVDRNRIKRLGREAYRLQKELLLQRLTQKGLSMAVFFIYTGKELPEYTIVAEKIGVILQKLIKEIT
jgi:ribonuclease P protein component